jgi:ADP-heptose:LPS heptosyltransferase
MIGFCPGAEFGPAKRWPHYHYAELAKQLIDEGYQIVLFGSAKDHEAGNEILARSVRTAGLVPQSGGRNPAGAGGYSDRRL